MRVLPNLSIKLMLFLISANTFAAIPSVHQYGAFSLDNYKKKANVTIAVPSEYFRLYVDNEDFRLSTQETRAYHFTYHLSINSTRHQYVTFAYGTFENPKKCDIEITAGSPYQAVYQITGDTQCNFDENGNIVLM